MCGRYTLHTSLQTIADLFEFEDRLDVAPRYNVAPSQAVLIVRENEAHKREPLFAKWGLVPFWAKDPKIGYKMINARGEDLRQRPAYRAAFKRRRCLIAADGFYEWKKLGQKQKQPYYICMKDRAPFGFAGLYEHWMSAQGDEILSCTIITTSPNDLVKEAHDRMPVILPKQHFGAWLDSSLEDTKDLDALLKPCEPGILQMYPVTTTVNSPRNDVPECILPLNQMRRLVITKSVGEG